ncbi:MAG: hypothetical protein WBD05_01870, partial [Phycisphaerae bacterium]
VWDQHKWNRDIKERERAVLKAIGEDIEENVSLLRQNETILAGELNILAQKKSMVFPLRVLKEGFWDLAKVNLPRKLVENPQGIQRLRDVSQFTSRYNEVLRARENWQVNNQALDNYGRRLEYYDKELLRLQGLLQEKHVALRNLLEPEAHAPNPSQSNP